MIRDGFLMMEVKPLADHRQTELCSLNGTSVLRQLQEVTCPVLRPSGSNRIHKQKPTFPVLISPGGMSQIRVLKQLLTSGLPVIRPERESRAPVGR